MCLFTVMSSFLKISKYCNSVNELLLLCMCDFFIFCLFFTIIEDNLSQTYISFINKTKQVYMNKVMAQINANAGITF